MSESRSDVVVSQQKAARPPPLALGINVEKPKFPQYAVYSKRMESFESWPEYIPVKKDDLVEAGLVYTGVGDSVRCYFCGGGLRNWEQGDIPMEEHGKWYPKCPHVMLVKGQGYVEKLQKGEKPEETPVVQTDTACAAPNHLESIAALRCLEFGYSKEIVKKAIDIFIARSGHHDFKAAQLSEIIMDLEDEIHQPVPSVSDCKCLFPTEEEELESEELQSAGWVLEWIKSMITLADDTLKTVSRVMSLLARKFPSLFPDLKKVPSDEILAKFAEAIGENFELLGPALGVSKTVLDHILMDNHTSVKKIFGMLTAWKQKKPLTATLESLIQIMKTSKSVTIDWDLIREACF